MHVKNQNILTYNTHYVTLIMKFGLVLCYYSAEGVAGCYAPQMLMLMLKKKL